MRPMTRSSRASPSRPASPVMPNAVGAQVKLHVVAHFTDGTARDVTPYAIYDTSDPSVFKVDGAGVVTGLRWGGAAITVRYLGTVQSATLTLPRADKTPYPKIAADEPDRHLRAGQPAQSLNVVPSRLTTDREFARRVYLDVCGRLPEPSEIDAFAADAATDKRAKLIDRPAGHARVRRPANPAPGGPAAYQPAETGRQRRRRPGRGASDRLGSRRRSNQPALRQVRAATAAGARLDVPLGTGELLPDRAVAAGPDGDDQSGVSGAAHGLCPLPQASRSTAGRPITTGTSPRSWAR